MLWSPVVERVWISPMGETAVGAAAQPLRKQGK